MLSDSYIFLLFSKVLYVYTGDVIGAGTDADVFINIFGEYGDTGNRFKFFSNHSQNILSGLFPILRAEEGNSRLL